MRRGLWQGSWVKINIRAVRASAVLGSVALLLGMASCGTIPDELGVGPEDPAVEKCEYAETGEAAKPVDLP